MADKALETLYLTPLLADPAQMKREAVRRRKLFDEKNVGADEIADHETDGWVVDKSKKLKKKTRIKKQKVLDERLENRFWYVLFRMGYAEMNDGRSFTVLIQRKGAEALRKQIDVFAKDDETVVVAECKASEKVAKRSLQKDIEEFAPEISDGAGIHAFLVSRDIALPNVATAGYTLKKKLRFSGSLRNSFDGGMIWRIWISYSTLRLGMATKAGHK